MLLRDRLLKSLARSFYPSLRHLVLSWCKFKRFIVVGTLTDGGCGFLSWAAKIRLGVSWLSHASTSKLDPSAGISEILLASPSYTCSSIAPTPGAVIKIFFVVSSTLPCYPTTNSQTHAQVYM